MSRIRAPRAYADVVDRRFARYALAIDTHARVVSLLGGLRGYKGLGQLLDAFELLSARDPQVRLLVAGSPDGSAEVDRLLARMTDDPRVALHARMIPADDMQLFVRASDVLVLPYERTLNSGVIMLGLAFGLPVVAPRLGGLEEFDDPRIVRLFTPGDPQDLVRAIRDALAPRRRDRRCGPPVRPDP